MVHKTDILSLENRIMGDPLLKLVFRKGAHCDLYLVGGILRDLVLGRLSTDRDFVLRSDPRGLAKEIASETGGKMFMLGAERLYRVILPERTTLDFSILEGDIEDDLGRRDFTINSLAWSPRKGVVDPNRGLRDLRHKIIRMIDRDSFFADPVRVVRAYRFAAELGFAIDRETRTAMKDLSSLVKEAKAERITLEFFRIMNVHKPWNIVKLMLEDDLLEQIIHCPYGDLREIIKVDSSFDEILDVLPLRHQFRDDGNFSQNLTYSGLLRLQYLVPAGSKLRLALSSKIRRRLLHIEKSDSYRKAAETRGLQVEDISFELIEMLGDAAEDYFIVRNRPALIPLYDKYRQVMGKGLLSTAEIREFCGLEEGEMLGRAIRTVRRAHFYNEISSKESAKEFLRQACADH